MKVYIIRYIYFLYWKILIGMDYKKSDILEGLGI